MRDGWNFHNDVAIPLEGDAIHYFGWAGRPFDKIFDAACIEQGCFVEDMIILLREKTEYSNEKYDIDNFIKDCSIYIGVNGNSIPPQVAQEMYDKFKRLFN